MSHHHIRLNARRRAVFKRDGWRHQTQHKRLTWRGLFGGRKTE